MANKRILLIDENEQLRNAYRIFISSNTDYDIIGYYKSYEDAHSKIADICPSIIVLDISNNQADCIRKIKDKCPKVEVLIYTYNTELEKIQQSFRNGAAGYISKKYPASELLEAFQVMSEGGCPMSPNIAKVLTSSMRLNISGPLSAREREILQMYARGYGYAVIADRLFVSKATVKTHLRNIYVKLNASGKEEAIDYAREKRYIA